MICSEEHGQTTVLIVYNIIQIHWIYIFCKHKARHEQ
jgi:hypothetical protein